MGARDRKSAIEITDIPFSALHKAFIDRFIETCLKTEKMAAAFLGGLYAMGTATAHSDLDLFVVIQDGFFDEFLAGVRTLLEQLGQLAFLEHFGNPATYFFIFADGTEGELHITSIAQSEGLIHGPFVKLAQRYISLEMEKIGTARVDQTHMLATNQNQLNWFWHDLPHFITATSRRQFIWAHGQVERLRR